MVSLSCNNKKNIIVEVENKNIKLGKLTTLDTVKLTYKIQNIGSRVLKIDSVISSCDCIVIDNSNRNIEPNNYTNIKVALVPKLSDSVLTTKNIMFSANTDTPFTSLSVSYFVRK